MVRRGGRLLPGTWRHGRDLRHGLFTDAGSDQWYSDAVARAAQNGVVSGYGGGVFGVNDPARREQVVTILWRYAGSPESGAAADVSDAAGISDWAREAGAQPCPGAARQNFAPKLKKALDSDTMLRSILVRTEVKRWTL